MAPTRQQALNDALERLSDIGFTMAPDFAEHGPMAAEALSAMGRNDSVAAWVEAYKARHRHFAPPPSREPIDEHDDSGWRNALGKFERTTDWHRFFNRALAERPWQEVVGIWAPRLVPGYVGALTHGLIRTAHAVRGIAEAARPTPLQLDELARGLAYWAGSYREIEGAATATATAAAPRDAADASLALNRHAASCGRILLANIGLPIVPVIQLLHTVTSTAAMRLILPYLPEEFAAEAVGTVRHVSGALAARLAPGDPPAVADFGLLPDREQLIDRAADHRDDHVIKLTEACLREDAFLADPVFRALPMAVAAKIPAWSR